MHCVVHYLLAMLDIKDLSEIINTTRLCNKVEINKKQEKCRIKEDCI